MTTDSGCQHTPLTSHPTPDRQQLALTANLFRAMGDPERLQLLVMLQAGERCVSELVDDGNKFTTVSARLQALLAAGLICRRREAKHMYYRVADAHVAHLISNALEHAAHCTSPSSPGA